MKEFLKRNWWMIAVLEVLIMGILTFLCFHKNRVVVDAPLDSWESWLIDYNGDSWYMDESIVKEKIGESKSVDMIYGPYIAMKKGSYTVIVDYEAQGDHTCSLSADKGENNEAYLVYSPVVLAENEASRAMKLELTEDIDNFGVKIIYGGSGYLKIKNIQIVENKVRDVRRIATLFFLFAAIDCLYLFRKIISRHRKTFCALAGILFLVSLPEMIHGFYYYEGQDMPFHLLRIEGIAQELRLGHFPARIHSLSINGYGYPVSVFYGDVLLYLPALLRIAGFSVISAYKIYILFVNILTIAISYYSFEKMFGKKNIAILGTLVYVTEPYRLADIYVRSAVGEFTAMAVMPLAALAVYQIYTSKEYDDWKKYRKNSLLLALGMTGLITSHILSTEMVVITLIIICLVCWKKTVRKNTLRVYLLAVVQTCLLCAYFIIPFLDYYLNVDVNITDHVHSGTMKIQRFGTYIGEYFAFFRDSGGLASETITGRMQMTPGIVLMGVLIVWLVLRVSGMKNRRCQFFAGGSMIALFIASNLFPWDKLAAHTKIGSLLAQVQYPWRYIGIAAVFLTLLFCEMLNMEEIQSKYDIRKTGVCVGILSGLMMVYITGNIYDSADNSAGLKTAHAISTYDTCGIDTESVGAGEYLRTNSEDLDLNYNRYNASGTTAFYVLERKGNRIVMHCETVETEAQVEVPLFNYKGYHAVDNFGSELKITDGENNYICVNIPQNYTGDITVSFKEPVYWRIAELVTLVSVILLVIFEIKNINLQRRRYDV